MTAVKQRRFEWLRTKRLPDQTRATGIEHLTELRARLIWSCLTLVACFSVGYAFADRILKLLNAPLNGRFEIVTLGVTEPFMTIVTVSAYAALIAAGPVLVYHLYQFLAPALDKPQRRALLPYLLFAPVLFIGGVAFGYFVVLDPAVQFLLGIGAETFSVQVRAREYYSFVSMALLGMGLMFLLPIVILGAAKIGAITSTMLRMNRRYAVLLAAIVAALLPTADPVSLALEMLPLVVLFELSILLVRLHERRAKRRARRGGE